MKTTLQTEADNIKAQRARLNSWYFAPSEFCTVVPKSPKQPATFHISSYSQHHSFLLGDIQYSATTLHALKTQKQRNEFAETLLERLAFLQDKIQTQYDKRKAAFYETDTEAKELRKCELLLVDCERCRQVVLEAKKAKQLDADAAEKEIAAKTAAACILELKPQIKERCTWKACNAVADFYGLNERSVKTSFSRLSKNKIKPKRDEKTIKKITEILNKKQLLKGR